MLNKVKSMKFSDYIEVQKEEYTYIQVIPSKSCKNTNTDKLLTLANTMYRKLDKLSVLVFLQLLDGITWIYVYSSF